MKDVDQAMGAPDAYSWVVACCNGQKPVYDNDPDVPVPQSFIRSAILARATQQRTLSTFLNISRRQNRARVAYE